MRDRREFAAIVPVCATHGTQTEALEDEVCRRLPESPPLFPEEQVTDRSERFLAAELVREKLTRLLGDELPYAVTVEIEQFKESPELTTIGAVIWVERDAQKAIVIGRQGQMLKQIGTQAREEMERLFGAKVYLQLWVKVKENWSDDERALRSLGYGE
jgi:GTP-binding protein Era